MKLATKLCALTLATALGTNPAQADVQGQARLGNLRLTLFDLDLSDSVTPSLTWSIPQDLARPASTGGVSIWYEVYGDEYAWGDSYKRYQGATPRGPAMIDYVPGSEASISAAYTHPTELGQLLSLSLRNTPAAQTNTLMMGDVYGETLAFTLSPHTRVSISIDLIADAAVRAVDSHEEFLQFSGSLGVVDYREFVDYDSANFVLAAGTLPGMRTDFADTSTLTADFSNASGDARYGSLFVSLGTEAWAQPVSAVPEPSRLAMLLAGGILLGWRLSRKPPSARPVAAPLPAPGDGRRPPRRQA